jgi:sigma-54 dependent transcriptional regulator, acetoin dehydrogenase operon transcriptional activator AcoR
VSPELGTIPAGRRAWRQTMEVRERFLAAADPDRLPPAACGVRREIIMSWRRCLLSGVDPTATTLPRDGGAVPPERLDRAAGPVVERLADQIAGMPAWSFLADRQCRLVRYVVGDPALVPQLEARGAVPGARFGEDEVGTNGLGTAVEAGQPFIVAGSEHFRAHESEATTAGAPVRDPVTGRLVGLLNVNCPYELTNGLMLPYITELASSIEARLAADSPLADRALVEEFLRVCSRCPGAVVAVSKEVFLANAAALALLDGADHEVLWQWACDAPARDGEHAARVRLTSGRALTARLRPVTGPPRRSAVVTLATAADPKTAVGPAARPSWGERAVAQLDLARRARLPVLLEGEHGTGKTALARSVHDQAGGTGRLTVLDAADGDDGSAEWLRTLGAAMQDPAATVVVRHLDALSPALVAPTVRLADAAPAWLVATATGPAVLAPGGRPPETPRACGRQTGRFPLVLAGRFPVVLDVPPLRDRAADIPALVTSLIAELRPEPPRPRCTPQALAVLAGGEWPGNVRQLRQVVATALVRSLSCDITVDDLPDAGCWTGRDRRGSRLEQAERQALVAALRDAAGDAEAAARDLGISRATIYRKLKRHGIRPDAR